MDKKQLSALPRPILTKQQREMPLLVSHMSYLITVSREDIAGKDTLIMNFFRWKGEKLEPEFRTFCQMDDYISQDLTVKNTKWRSGAVNYLAGYIYYHEDQRNLVISSLEERNTLLQFFKDFRKLHRLKKSKAGRQKTDVDTEIEENIDHYQNTIKDWRLKERRRKLKQAIDLDMDKFGTVPKGYGKFIRDTVFSEDHYIFYSRKEKRAYCTSCGKEFMVTPGGHLKYGKAPVRDNADKVKHNKSVPCPHCKKSLTCKSEGMGRQQLYTVRWSVLLQNHGEEVLVRYLFHIKDFRKNLRRPQIKTTELYRTVHSADGSKDYMWGRFKSTYEKRWGKYRTRWAYGWGCPSEELSPSKAILYRANLEEAIAGTCMKYSAVDLYVDKVIDNGTHLKNPWYIDWYFNAYRERPYLEQLLKIGFYNIVKGILWENDYNLPNVINGKTVIETLGIDRIKFKMLVQKKDPSMKDLKILQYANKIKETDFMVLSNTPDIGVSLYKGYINLMKFSSLHKINKYLQKAKLSEGKVNDYFDYIEWLEALGYDMRNEFNIYPKDFQRSHDEKYKEYQAYQNKKKREEMRRFNQIIKQMKKEKAEIPVFNMSYNGMLLRLPENSTELKREGQALHHCVGSYIEKVGKGETLIFFIRRKEKPEKPYYTLEWKGKVVQCRGMNNCAMTQEIKEFVDLFSKEMGAYEKKLRREQIRKDRTWKGKEFTAYEKDPPNGMRRTG
ncbi:PcfJ domain-containing protein [Clostridiales Family XIII bacterium ASD5510]|uniref:PcfJ domain-containing protein n=1 Tax=Hominibacterium faecale TaxID=2839743 RepID=A0A9J6QYE5_9FIRM|nr:PcfJ domain-containing protein [Hominibacterium faecale]MCU7380482.1 PcfJ domain-containing protein [Hominibacterium faecale]